MQESKINMKIGVFAPSSPAIGDRTEDTYAYLCGKGFEVYEHPQVRKVTEHTAGSVEDRVAAIHELYQDPTVDMLMSFWGGQNSNELLPHLNYSLIKANPKPLIGYSDTTALLLAITKQTGVTTYMGPAAITFTKPEPIDYSYENFEKLVIKKEEVIFKDADNYADDHYYLNDDPTQREIHPNPGRRVLIEGTAMGEIIAANLQTLLVLSGSRFLPDLKGKILFLEESEDTNVGVIHRFLTQLTQITDINDLKGICFGRFCQQSGFSNSYPVEKLLEIVFRDATIPIIYDLNFGHSDPILTIPNGGYAEIDTARNLIKISASK